MRMSEAAGEPHLPQRIPVLDGVRGLAVFLILFHHSLIQGPQEYQGPIGEFVKRLSLSCWFGVDLFFVLSGFLITGILYDALGKPRYFANFYLRRLVRIFPVYYLFLAAFFLVFCPLFASRSPHLEWLWQHQAAFWLYVQNLLSFFVDGYFPGNYFVGHLWSLAVEEQFYLVWPLLLFWAGKKSALRLCVALFLFSIGIRLAMWKAGAPPIALYRFTPACMDALMVGATLAVLYKQGMGIVFLSRFWKPAAGILGLALIAIAIPNGALYRENDAVQTVGATMVALFFGSLLAGSLQEGSSIRSWLDQPFWRFLGQYSYAIYIFHWPLLAFLEKAWLRFLGPSIAWQFLYFPLALALAVGVALLSWHLVEKRFSALKRYMH
jgi:peptidoglycan/LPS O-acetylase OafA/YrhL